MANKSTILAVRMEPELKTEVESILGELGLNTTQAVNLFFSYVKRERGIPFAVKLPERSITTNQKTPVAGPTIVIRGLHTRPIHHANSLPYRRRRG